MDITKVDIFPVPGNSKLKARADLTLGHTGKEVKIKGFRIHDDGIKEPWVGVPQEKYFKDGVASYKETHWLNQSAQTEIYPRILSEYKKHFKIKSQ